MLNRTPRLEVEYQTRQRPSPNGSAGQVNFWMLVAGASPTAVNIVGNSRRTFAPFVQRPWPCCKKFRRGVSPQVAHWFVIRSRGQCASGVVLGKGMLQKCFARHSKEVRRRMPCCRRVLVLADNHGIFLAIKKDPPPRVRPFCCNHGDGPVWIPGWRPALPIPAKSFSILTTPAGPISRTKWQNSAKCQKSLRRGAEVDRGVSDIAPSIEQEGRRAAESGGQEQGQAMCRMQVKSPYHPTCGKAPAREQSLPVAKNAEGRPVIAENPVGSAHRLPRLLSVAARGNAKDLL